MGSSASKHGKGHRLDSTETERKAPVKTKSTNKKHSSGIVESTKSKVKTTVERKPKVDKTKSYTLSSGTGDKTSEDPAQAARKAAEERFKKQSSSNGVLGAKLAKEKAQSTLKNTQLQSKQELRRREIEGSQ